MTFNRSTTQVAVSFPLLSQNLFRFPIPFFLDHANETSNAEVEYKEMPNEMIVHSQAVES
jgi:hypothetical protein